MKTCDSWRKIQAIALGDSTQGYVSIGKFLLVLFIIILTLITIFGCSRTIAAVLLMILTVSITTERLRAPMSASKFQICIVCFLMPSARFKRIEGFIAYIAVIVSITGLSPIRLDPVYVSTTPSSREAWLPFAVPSPSLRQQHRGCVWSFDFDDVGASVSLLPFVAFSPLPKHPHHALV